MSGCQHHRELLGGYVLDALDPGDEASVREHLATCASCRHEHEELRRVPPLLGLLDTPEPAHEQPAASLEEAVLDRFARERRAAPPAPPAPRRRPWRSARIAVAGAAAAAAATLVLAGVFSGDEESAFGHARLNGPGGATAHADLRAVRAGTGVALSARGLPSGREAVYELWCVPEEGRWISGGTFRVDERGAARVSLTSAARPGDYELIVVTRRADRRRVLAGSVEY